MFTKIGKRVAKYLAESNISYLEHQVYQDYILNCVKLRSDQRVLVKRLMWSLRCRGGGSVKSRFRRSREVCTNSQAS